MEKIKHYSVTVETADSNLNLLNQWEDLKPIAMVPDKICLSFEFKGKIHEICFPTHLKE